ncbi:MAG: hypothetical protein ACOC9Y_00690 [Chloroflexota bacterium]
MTPDIPALLALCASADIDYVLGGSVAAMAHGVDLVPGDLDIVPALYFSNLERIANLLRLIEAEPEGFGYWTTREDGRRKWIVEPLTEERLNGWRPDPSDLDTLDHLFLTPHGNFDIVPSLMGTYEELFPHSVEVQIGGRFVRVLTVNLLIERLRTSSRAKDAARLEALMDLRKANQ